MMKDNKLMDSMSSKQENKKYDLAKVIFDLKNSDTSDYSNLEVIFTENSTKVRPITIL